MEKGVFGCYENTPEVTKKVKTTVDFSQDTSVPGKGPVFGNKENMPPSSGPEPLPSMFSGGKGVPAKSDVGRARSSSY